MTMTAKQTRSISPEARQAEKSNPELSRHFEALFLEHWPGVYGLLLRLVGDHAEAEDLALEAFLRLYQRPSSDDAAFNPGGWLHRVATNLGLNAIRGWKRRQQYEQAAGREEIGEGKTAGPAEIFAAEEEQRRVRQVLSEMNPRQSQLLVLRHSGMAYRDIAAAMGLSQTSIGPLLLRAETEFEKRYRAANPEGG
ncbi:MAG TPA: sigma-70 family RNA polymerase sigma factor [Anaerolineales bacterium]